MLDYEKTLLDYYCQFIDGNREVVIEAWNLIKRATYYPYITDKTRCLTSSDFFSTGLLSIIKSFESFKPDAGSKITTWCITVANQRMIRLLKSNINKLVKIPIDSLNNNDQGPTLDSVMAQFCEDFEPVFITDEYYSEILTEVLKRLYNINRRVYKLLNFKLSNIDLPDATIGRKLSINANSYKKYLITIRTIFKEVMEEN